MIVGIAILFYLCHIWIASVPLNLINQELKSFQKIKNKNKKK